MVLARLRRIHKSLPCKGERQIHADNISTQQPPSQASTSSVRTQPLSYRGPASPEKQGDSRQVTHSTWRSRTDTTHFLIPASQHKSHEDNAHFRGWRVVGTELHLVPRLPPSPPATRIVTESLWHTAAGSKLAPTPNEDWHPAKTQHPPRQTSPDTTDDAHQCFAARQHENCLICPPQTVFFWAVRCLKNNISGKKQQHCHHLLTVTPLIG